MKPLIVHPQPVCAVHTPVPLVVQGHTVTRTADHRYVVDGSRCIPSVSAVMAIVPLEQPLVSDLILSRARAYGQAVHAMLEYYERGVLDDTALDPALRPILDAYTEQIRPQYESIVGAPVTVWAEHIVADLGEYPWAGTPDIVLCGPRGGAVIDYKTGSRIPLTARLQTAAYAWAVPTCLGVAGVVRRFVLHLSANKWRLCEFPDDESDRETFAAFLRVHQFVCGEAGGQREH